MIRQYELVERVKAYDPTADEGALNRAYVFSLKAHGAQIRASGDPYFSHPLEVAGILTGLKLDCDTIVTALLHDTVEDTLASLDEIENHFGSPVARLVDGVTKLSQLELQSDQTKYAENFRKFVLAMSKDIRVLLVKLADRLHNMRTLSFIENGDKRRRIANETMDIYAPLAERIGLQMIKEELEDLAFAEINMDARNSVQARLDFLRAKAGDVVPRILAALREMLAGHRLRAVVEGREKRLYSIWRKMEIKNIAFEQLSDIVAFRIIVDSEADCYRALGFVHGAYPMVPGKFKDYISTPKPNGYRSLHTSVMGPESQRIEIQIRTREMHEEAELGVAAHWAFKQTEAGSDGKQYRWLRELLDILDNAAGPEDFLEHTKLEMFRDQVFCFTPHGDLINLPRDATPVDFAYAVHSEVGDTCVGAKINGRSTPLRTELENGDQVEIITSGAQTPSPSWENFVVTGKASRADVQSFEVANYTGRIPGGPSGPPSLARRSNRAQVTAPAALDRARISASFADSSSCRNGFMRRAKCGSNSLFSLSSPSSSRRGLRARGLRPPSSCSSRRLRERRALRRSSPSSSSSSSSEELPPRSSWRLALASSCRALLSAITRK